MTAPAAPRARSGAPAPLAADWLSCAGAATRLGLTPSRVAQLRREGRLRAVQTPLGWLYDPADLTRFQNERKQRA